MPHDVFISHSSKDKLAADAVCAALERAGVSCWIAPRDVRPGTPYAAEIVQAINDSRLMVVLHSAASNDSPEVYREVERAGAKRVAIISLRIERCEISRGLEYFLSSVQWIDATKPPLADHLKSLVDAVKALLDGGVQAANAPPVSSKPTGPPRKSTRPARRPIWRLVLGAFAVSALWNRLGPRHERQASPAHSAEHPHPVTLSDLPLPATTVPQARIEYAAGIQILRDDGGYMNALHHFAKAAELDPAMAQAHLRLAMMDFSTGVPEKARTELAMATAQRAQLSDRDVAILDAVEPEIGHAVPDLAQTVDRLQAAHDCFPNDYEITQQLAFHVRNEPERALALARRATELDPKNAEAWETLGRAQAVNGNAEDGRAALERCAGISNESSDCASWLATIDGAEGHCEAMEQLERRHADNDPRDGYFFLAVAQAAAGRSEATVRETIGAEMATVPREEQGIRLHQLDAPYEALLGHFDKALTMLDEEIRAFATGDPRENLRNRLIVARLRIQLLTETGNGKGAREAARSFMEHAELTDPDSSRFFDFFGFWLVARTAGATLDPARHNWIEVELKGHGSGAIPWSFGWAVPATTPDEAREALAALAADSRLSVPKDGQWLFGIGDWGSASIGRMYLLAGRPAEAIPYLRGEANSCFALREPVLHAQARVDLAEALRQTGDAKGACDSYAMVVAQWGKATPRSVSAETASAAMKKLGCGK